ncbi:MAG TPA: chorismate synthase [Saprospiraceae bacterium]|nr:chorismate synthase [Saprospiraceae bacterium]
MRKEQQTIDMTGQSVQFAGTGRHDPCVVPRAVPIVEAMTSLVLVDHFLRQKTSQR